jgi:release factor glutamine methyltransferase
VDISDKALQVAKKNALKHGVKAEFIKGDMLDGIKKKYDIIVSNPPYIETSEIDNLENSVKNYEPFIALDGGDDGLIFYRKIRNSFLQNLKPKGILFLEIGYNQGTAIKEIFKDFDIQIKKDYGGHDRIAIIKIKSLSC